MFKRIEDHPLYCCFDDLDSMTAYIEEHPDDAEAYGFRGEEYSLKGGNYYGIDGDWDLVLKYYGLACDDLTRAIELQPDNGLYYAERAGTYFMRNMREEAIEDYSMALERIEDSDLRIEFLKNRAHCYRYTGQNDLAVADIDEMYAGVTDRKEQEQWLWERSIHQPNAPRRIQDLTKLLALNPDHRQALELRAQLYTQLGRYDEAMEDALRGEPLATTESQRQVFQKLQADIQRLMDANLQPKTDN